MTKTATYQRQDIELIRVISAFGIVYFHSFGDEISYASLIVFIIVSMYFSRGGAREITISFVAKRAIRLLVPWVTWLFIYGVVNLLRQKSFINPSIGVVPGFVLGSSIHLWYMPFIFGCMLLFDVVKNNLSDLRISITCPLVAAILLFSTSLWRQFSIDIGPPLAQYFHALPAVFIGVYFSYFYSLPRLAAFLLLAVVLASEISALGCKGVGITYLVATVISLVLLVNSGWRPRKIDISPISKCMLGVYFLHVLFLVAVTKYTDITGVYIPVFVFLTSTAVVYIGRRSFPGLANYWS